MLSFYFRGLARFFDFLHERSELAVFAGQVYGGACFAGHGVAILGAVCEDVAQGCANRDCVMCWVFGGSRQQSWLKKDEVSGEASADSKSILCVAG